MPDSGHPATTPEWLADWIPTYPPTAPASADTPADRLTRRRLQRRLEAELASVRTELARVDAKTSTLLGLAGVLLGGGLAALGGAGRQLPLTAAVPAWLAAVAVGAAVVLLAVAVKPNLRGSFGFVRWCRTTDAQQLLDDLADDGAGDPLAGAAGQLRWLSCALVAKYTAVRRAVTLLLVGLGGGALAAALTMWTNR